VNRLAFAALVLLAPSARAQTATTAGTRGARWGQCDAPAPTVGALPYDAPGGAPARAPRGTASASGWSSSPSTRCG
jgi:hypothetical protein